MTTKYNNRDGIILAAGLGSRLKDSCPQATIKPLANIESLSLLVRTINSLEQANCKRVVIVLGWQAEEIRNQIIHKYSGPLYLDFVYNSEFHLKNGISVLCARPLVSGEFILTMADHILDDSIMHLVRDHHPPENGATLCVDYKLETIFDIDDATKVLAADDLIIEIGKNLKKYNCIDTGVFLATDGLMEAIDHLYKQEGDASLSEGVQSLANRGLMEILDIKGAFWQDVDNLDMLMHAKRLLKSDEIISNMGLSNPQLKCEPESKGW